MLFFLVFRVIVDDVDEEDRLHPVNNERLRTETDCGIENPIARIKQIQVRTPFSFNISPFFFLLTYLCSFFLPQVEAESRKIEFARLLEEHAQVIRRLKQMEESESVHHIQNAVAGATKA